jgi:hypothetical protein
MIDEVRSEVGARADGVGGADESENRPGGESA